LEGTGADGSGFGLLETLHGQHHRISLGHMRDEQGIYGLQSNHDRMIVRRFDGSMPLKYSGWGLPFSGTAARSRFHLATDASNASPL
jgi:hypothetical protein